jgi:hypothetical protein
MGGWVALDKFVCMNVVLLHNFNFFDGFHFLVIALGDGNCIGIGFTTAQNYTIR